MRDGPVAGAYIAWHRWLDDIAKAEGTQAIVKIGHSGRLGGRLRDGSYTTCWSEGWRYLATFEVATKEEAQAIEEGCLHSLAPQRIDGRELVKVTPEYAITFLSTVADALKIQGKLCLDPTYQPEEVPRELAEATFPSKYAEAIKALPSLSQPCKEHGKPMTPPESQSPSSTPEQPPHGDSGPIKFSGDEVEMFGQIEVESQWLLPEQRQPLEERKYQEDAAQACFGEICRLGRTTLVMACRCGKTRVAHKVISKLWDWVDQQAAPEEQGYILFLVPWLALLRQTVDKLCSYGVDPAEVVMIGSASATSACQSTAGGAMTTNPAVLAARLRGGARVVVSTYHSSHVALDGMREFGRDSPTPKHYLLTVFDECHHVCGGMEPRPNNHVLLTAGALTGARLFMTATPVVQGAKLSMNDHALFGGVAYRYHLRQGIEAGYVNDYEIQLVASSADAIRQLALQKDAGADAAARQKKGMWERFVGNLYSLVMGDSSGPTPDWGALEMFAQEKVLAAQIALAYEDLVSGDSKRNKLLVFCRTIRGAEKLLEEVSHLFSLISAARGKAVEVELLQASSQTPKAELSRILNGPFSDPNTPAILFNCKLFQEGVEFPPLNGVFFATPRHSSRDIIQSLCRALTRVPEKPRSVVYIPVPSPEKVASINPYESLGRFETLLPFAEAVYSEDPRFYEHLLDPSRPYPIGWIGSYGDAEMLLHSARRAIRYGANWKPGKKCIDRLTRSARIPWEEAFKELKRIVEVCKRYPKGNDGFEFAMARELEQADPHGKTEAVKVLNFGQWYDWARQEYIKFTEGSSSHLQPHQVRDLESLEQWKTRGIDGPYPPDECLDTLERVLEQTQGVMPPININNGGWIGLDATPLERLSGFLTTISQQDGRGRDRSDKRGFTISDHKAKRLDAIFGKWGLTWRKARDYSPEEIVAEISATRSDITQEEAVRRLIVAGKPGILRTQLTKTGKAGDYVGPRTVIQTAHEQFRQMAKTNPKDPFIQANWPGYPEKHARMEHAEVWEKGLAPPRHAKGKLIARAPKKQNGADP